MFSLDGSVILVTGAAAGIGAATVARLNGAGAQVVGLDVDPLPDDVRELCALGLVADVSRDDQVQVAVSSTVEQLGRLDAVVNNAGVSPSDLDVVDDSDAAYLRAYRVNVLGALHVTRSAVPHLPRGSAIVNIASLSALIGAPGLGAYASSKAALVELTRTSALELADRGVRVNAIAPSGVDTQMLAGDSAVVRRERVWIDAAAAIPRLITPDEVAACVHFLVAQESSAITGQCLVVDGGIGSGPTPALLDRLEQATEHG